jgi:hypothetical protein
MPRVFEAAPFKKKMVAPFWTYFEAIHIFTQHCIGSPAHGDETKLQ